MAVAIAAHGVPSATAFGGGLAFSVAEGAAGVGFGLVATATFVLGGGLRSGLVTDRSPSLNPQPSAPV